MHCTWRFAPARNSRSFQGFTLNWQLLDRNATSLPQKSLESAGNLKLVRISRTLSRRFISFTSGQQLNRHQQPQQGRPVKCNVIKERLAACLFICHNRRLVSRLIIHRRAIITPTSNHPHRALESFKGISAQFLSVFLENTPHA